MAIRKETVISVQDFDDAVESLGVTVSEVATATRLPRGYLSEFRKGRRVLRPEQLRGLREFFEARGIEFEDAPAETVDPDADAVAVPHPRLRAVQRVRCYFPISDEVPDDVVAKAIDVMDEADARLAVLLKTEATAGSGILGGEYTPEAEKAIRDAIMLAAQNYLIFRMVRGWTAFNVEPMKDGDVRVIRDVLCDTFRSQLADAGLLDVSDAAPVDEKIEEEEAA